MFVPQEANNAVDKLWYLYHKLRKAFSNLYRRHHELVSKLNVGLKSILHQGLSEQEFYGNWYTHLKRLWEDHNCDKFTKNKPIYQTWNIVKFH